MNNKLISEWLKTNKPTACENNSLNRDTITIDFKGNIKRKSTKRKLKLCVKQL